MEWDNRETRRFELSPRNSCPGSGLTGGCRYGVTTGF
jgi:hypothetical protein